MIARILDSRIIDLLLIVLALRFIFPNLFSLKAFKSEKKTERIIIVHKEKEIEKKSASDKAGEYVEYEEVK